MSAFLESLLKGTAPSVITEFFFWLIMTSLVIALLCRKTGKSPDYVNYSATLLTSLGILGTFIGIVVGLLDFNAEDIDGSIGLLLAGLKTAFITSLVGMSASIIYKVLGVFPLFVKREINNEVTGMGADDIYRAINEQGHAMHQSLLIQQDLLADLKRAIVGSEDDTLVSQVKLLRADMNDNHKDVKSIGQNLAVIQVTCTEQQQNFQQFSDRLWLKLQEVADTIAKSATEEVIKALRDVITDFNNNLTEQFGDNFKALDESVKKLVIWQENYSVQIEQMVEQYRQGVTAIDRTAISVASISENSAQIPITMNDLKDVMLVNQEQVETLGGHLVAFKEMRDHAIEAVPMMQEHVKAIVTDMDNSVKEINTYHKNLLNESSSHIKQYMDFSSTLLEKFVTDTTEAINLVKNGLAESSRLMAEELQQSGVEIKAVVIEGANEFKSAVGQTNSSLVDMSSVLETQNESANMHYVGLLEKSGEQINQYLELHNDTTQDLLKDYTEQTKIGIEAIKVNLVEGSQLIGEELKQSGMEIKGVVIEGASEFQSSVTEVNQSLLVASEEINRQVEIMRESLQSMAIKLVDESKALSFTMQEANKQTSKDISKVQQVVVENTERLQKRFEGVLDEIFQAQTREVKRTFDALETEMKNAVGNTGNAVDEQIKNIEDATAQQINLVMNEMGRALSSISGKFTKDYSKLVSEMSAIVDKKGR